MISPHRSISSHVRAGLAAVLLAGTALSGTMPRALA